MQPPSPYTAAFGAPAVIVRCGVSVRSFDPTSDVLTVDGVDWLQLTPKRGVQDFVSYRSHLIVEVLIPRRYLPADILPPLSNELNR